MKTTSTFLPVRGRAFYLSGLLALLLSFAARAQFSTSPNTPLAVCSATGNQLGVQAFADGAGGSYAVWIDRRGGSQSGPGAALYLQRLDAAGTPLLAANGLRLFQTQGREIWGMKAIAWQSGMLVAWVQGAFGIGGDSVRCQYYDAAGAPQWAQPALVARRNSSTSPGVIYVSENGLNIIPTSTGAIITHDLSITGNSARFTFNEVSPTGTVRWPLNANQVNVSSPSNYPVPNYRTLSDGADGFYLVAHSSYSIGIQVQRFQSAGAVWSANTVLSADGPTGRGDGTPQPVLDPAGNLYVAWTSFGGDALVSKILPTGALGWPSPGYVSLCTFASRQANPHAIWHNNALWMVWEDNRLGTTSYNCYAQKIDAAGTLAWSPAGVPVYDQPAQYLRPRLVPSDNGSVMAFYRTNTAFQAQKLLPTGSAAFAINGVALSSVAGNQANFLDATATYLDHAPVSQSNGSVQVYWSTVGAGGLNQDILAARVQSSGSLLGNAARTEAALGFGVFPNPAAGEVRLRYSPTGPAPTGLRLYDVQGRLVRAFAPPTGPAGALSLRGLAAGIYVLRAELAGQPVSCRVAVATE